MQAFVTDGSSLLGATLIRALRWEGHSVTAVVSSLETTQWLAGDRGVVRIPESGIKSDRYIAVLRREDAVFDTSPDRAAVATGGRIARFVTGALVGPGEGTLSPLGRWIDEYLTIGRVRRGFGGTRVSDVRDVALAMMEAATQRRSGQFILATPHVDYAEILAMLEYLTGSNARNGGSVDIVGVPPELAGEPSHISPRPVHETMIDIVNWHATCSSSSRAVA